MGGHTEGHKKWPAQIRISSHPRAVTTEKSDRSTSTLLDRTNRIQFGLARGQAGAAVYCRGQGRARQADP